MRISVTCRRGSPWRSSTSTGHSAEPALPASTTFSDRVCMRFAAACRYVLDYHPNESHAHAITRARRRIHEALLTRITINAIMTLFLRNVRATTRLHHFTQLGTFTHEKRRDRPGAALVTMAAITYGAYNIPDAYTEAKQYFSSNHLEETTNSPRYPYYRDSWQTLVHPLNSA